MLPRAPATPRRLPSQSTSPHAAARPLPQTTCADSLTAADWIELMWSPRVHVAGEVDASLIRRCGQAQQRPGQARRTLRPLGCRHRNVACCQLQPRPGALAHAHSLTAAPRPLLCHVLSRLRKQRGTDVDCDAAGALASAAGMFRLRGAETTLDGGPLPGADPEAGAGAAQRRPFRQLGDACFLFARKFGPEAVPVRCHKLLLVLWGCAGRNAGQARAGGSMHSAARRGPDFLSCCPNPTHALQPLLELAADCQEGTGLAAACLTSASWQSPIHISSDLVQH